MSEMAAFITGIDLRVDGGIHHGRGGFLFKAKAGSSPPAFNGFHRDETAELLKD